MLDQDCSDQIFLKNVDLSRFVDYSVESWANRYRVEQSKRLLAEGGKYIKDIATKVGFIDQSYFAAVFKQETGMSPIAYQNLVRKK